MIYAIEAVGTPFIKFGKADSVGKRLKSLEIGCPFELHILAVIDWHDGAETAIHKLLEPHWERGEWHRDSELTQQVIGWMRSNDLGALTVALRALGLEKYLEHKAQKRRKARREAAFPRARGDSLSHAERQILKRLNERDAWWKLGLEKYLEPRWKHRAAQQSGAATQAHDSLAPNLPLQSSDST